MSGFEIAGLVLGTIPLVVKAVDAYISFMKEWGRTVSELKSINRQLTTERARLYNVCDQLLADIIPPGDVEPMLQDPFGPLWKDKQANEKIRTRLWHSYGPFEQTVLEVREALESIVARLRVNITSDGEVEWVDKRWMSREFKKFLHRLNRMEYEEALNTIFRGISRLEGLTRQSVSLEPVRKKRSRGRVIRVLRDLSASIHRALCSSIRCNDPHDVGLELVPQLMNTAHDSEDENVLHGTEFTISISFQMAEGQATKILWDQVKVKTMLAVNTPSPSRSPSPTPITRPTPSLSSLSSTVASKTKGSKFVSFLNFKSKQPSYMVGNAKASTTATLTEYNTLSTLPFVVSHQPAIQISTTTCFDFCNTLRKSRVSRPPCYGRLVDTQHTKHHFEVYPLGTTLDSHSWSVISLHDVLAANKGLPPLIGLEARYRLSLTIASSVLQLSKTPWLPGTLTSRDVWFLNRGGSISYQNPLLLKSFPELPPLQELTVHTPAQGSSHTIMNQNSTLFALGILLLEIILCSTIRQLREPQDFVPGLTGNRFQVAAIQDAMTAHRLLEQRVSLINPLYKTVVERCIGCAAPQDLDEEKFQQKVYDGVVMQLEEIWEYMKL